MTEKIFIVVDDGVEYSYWTTLRLAQAAIERYRQHHLVTDHAEIQTVSLNIDGFGIYKPKGRT